MARHQPIDTVMSAYIKTSLAGGGDSPQSYMLFCNICHGMDKTGVIIHGRHVEMRGPADSGIVHLVKQCVGAGRECEEGAPLHHVWGRAPGQLQAHQ